jgi:hypothetical protein
VILLISAVLPLAFWKICSKAGFPGALGLLIIFPVVNVILVLYLAFAEWPALRRNSQSVKSVVINSPAAAPD